MSPAPGPTPPSVDDKVTVRLTSPVLNRATGTFDVHATIINTSQSTLDASMLFVVTGTTPSGVTLANAAGTTADGFPFVTVPIASRGFMPGRAATVLLKFSTVSLARFTVNRSVRAIVRAAPSVVSLEPNSAVVALGSVQQLRLRIQNPSATQPMRVTLSSGGPTIVTVTPTVVIPAGRTTATATVAGRLVGGPVTVTATLGSSSATTNVSVARQPPAPVVFGPLREGATLVDGSGVVGAAVSVLVNGQVAGTGAVVADGHFTVVVPPLAVGNTVRTIQSVAGLPSAPSAQFIVAPAPLPAPIIEAPLVASATVVQGTAEPGATVDVMINGTPAASAVATTAGEFAATVPALTEGGRVSARQTRAGAQGVESATLIVVGSPPPPLVSTPLVAGATVVAGIAVHGATVTLSLDMSPIGTATVDASGTWSLGVTPLPVGGVITVSQTIAGHSSAPSIGITVVTPPPSPTILGPLVTGGLAVSGRGTPSATVELFIDTVSIGTTTVGSDGIWARTLTSGLTTGASVQATQTVGGLTSALSGAVTVVSPPPAPGVAAPIVAGLTQLTGTGTPGLTVDVEINGASGGVTDVTADGTWTLALDRVLVAGDAVRASQQLGGGVSVLSNTVIVVTPPPPPVIGEPLFADDTVVRGTGIPDASVRVFIDGAIAGSTAVNEDSEWSVPLTTPLVAGRRITATQTIAGIESPASAAVMVRAVLRRIDVSPASASLTVGQTQTFVARGTFSDGSLQSPLAGVQWSSDTPTVATIDASGVASAVGIGSTGIRASRDGIQSARVTLTVAATPTITWANPADITFGTPLGAAQLNATASVPGTFTYTPPAGTIFSVGNGQALSVVFTPTGATTSTTASVTINVLKATPTITWANPADIAFGTALSGTQLSATANVPGAFAYTPPAGTVLNAGIGQTLSVVFTPTDTGSFATATKTVTINVLKATPTITWATPADITFGTPLGAAQLNATASVPGTLTYSPPAGTVLTTGQGQTLSVTFTPTDSANFTTATKTVTINVVKATPPITWANPADITFGTVLSANELNATANVTGAFVYTPGAGTLLSIGNGQPLSVVFTPSDTMNFTSAVATVTINILPPPVGTINAASLSVRFGPPPAGTIGSTPVSVSFTPQTVQPIGSSRQFTPSVPGTTDQRFTFSVNGIVGGDTTVGTITPDGLYTAPIVVPSPPTVTIRATSVAIPSFVVERTLTVVGEFSAVVPPAVSVAFGSPPAGTIGSTPVSVEFGPPPSGAVGSQPISADFGPARKSAFAQDVSVTTAPVILSRSPGSAPAGASFLLTLNGANFSGATGLTFLLNGSSDASIGVSGLSVNPGGDQLTATLAISGPAPAGSRIIIVNTPSRTSTAADTGTNTFIVTAP